MYVGAVATHPEPDVGGARLPFCFEGGGQEPRPLYAGAPFAEPPVESKGTTNTEKFDPASSFRRDGGYLVEQAVLARDGAQRIFTPKIVCTCRICRFHLSCGWQPGCLPIENIINISSGREAATADARQHRRGLTPDFSVVCALDVRRFCRVRGQCKSCQQPSWSCLCSPNASCVYSRYYNRETSGPPC